MILGIDASNIRSGGGIQHLRNLLAFSDPKLYGIKKVVVWGAKNSIEKFPQNDWLDLFEVPVLEKSLLERLHWQNIKLTKIAEKYCDLLYIPGGLYLGAFRPYVSMFQNMQIFESKERKREGISKERLRLTLLLWAQSITFKRASGLICLSDYSKNYLNRFHSHIISSTEIKVINHGATKNLYEFETKKTEKSYSKKTLKLLYVSTVKKYKHQWNLIDAVGLLRKEGLPIELHLVGGGDNKALNLLKNSIQRNKLDRDYIFYYGQLSHRETTKWFYKADIFVFPSTCENFPITILEAMSAGLPVASSNRGPMPELLKDCGLYFNPESVSSIKNCLQYMLNNPKLAQSLGKKAKLYSKVYSWKKCADKTFSFLSEIYNKTQYE